MRFNFADLLAARGGARRPAQPSAGRPAAPRAAKSKPAPEKAQSGHAQKLSGARAAGFADGAATERQRIATLFAMFGDERPMLAAQLAFRRLTPVADARRDAAALKAAHDEETKVDAMKSASARLVAASNRRKGRLV